MTDNTDRFALPFIIAGQAQKEVAHNEALVLIDALLGVTVVAVGATTPPASPVLGQAWIVGIGAAGAWADKNHQLARFTSAGWRFSTLAEGFTVWSLADSKFARRTATGWVVGSINATDYKVDGVKVIGARQPNIASPIGGTVIDTEARVAIAALLTALQTHGLVA
jgi:Protein of unknown function (DUF2793)